MNQVVAEKTYHGWQAKTVIQLANSQRLEILTMKRHNGSLATTATVSTNEGNGFYSHVVYQDFSKTVYRTLPKRITKKVVEEQHNAIDIESIKQAAILHYQPTAETVE